MQFKMETRFKRKLKVVIKEEVPPEPKITLIQFPQELLYKIFININYQDIIALCKTNRYFNIICNDQYFWVLLMRKDFIDINIDNNYNIKSQYQLTLADKLAAEYNKKLNPLLANKKLKTKILGLTYSARLHIPLTTETKYIEIIVDQNEIKSITKTLETLGYNKRKVIPLFSFMEFVRDFGFLNKAITLNFRNCIGFTIKHNIKPIIFGYVFSYKKRLYLNWEIITTIYNDLSHWPNEFSKALESGTIKRENYVGLNIGYNSNIDFDDKIYDEEYL
jgi:hypothetical protein